MWHIRSFTAYTSACQSRPTFCLQTAPVSFSYTFRTGHSSSNRHAAGVRSPSHWHLSAKGVSFKDTRATASPSERRHPAQGEAVGQGMAPTGSGGRRRAAGARVVRAKEVSVEEDEEFWGQAGFGSESDDDSFDEEAHSDKGEDQVDSDFDAPEDGSEDEDAAAAVAEASARRASSGGSRRRNGKYVDPALKKTRSKGAAAPADGGNADPRPTKRAKIAPTVERTSLRKSTKAASARAGKEREEREAELMQRRIKLREKEKQRKPEKILTQEELLEESDGTAEKNREDLKRLLRLEEERKRVVVKEKAPVGETMSVRSRDGKTIVGFSDPTADAQKEMFPQCEDNEKKDDAGNGEVAKEN